MRKHRRAIIIAAIVVVVGVVVWISHRPSDPYYKGKPLSFWLAGYTKTKESADEPNYKDASEAIDQIGENAIPILLKLVEFRENAGTRLLHWAFEHHLIGEAQNPVPARERNIRGYEGFNRLGPRGSNAVPTLIEIFESTECEELRLWVVRSLGGVAPTASNAVPLLVDATTSTNDLLRGAAIQSLGYNAARPEISVPALTRCLNDPIDHVRYSALAALAYFKTNAKPAVPALLKLLEEPATTKTAAIAETLMEIDPASAKLAIPKLRELGKSENRYIREMAERTLRDIQQSNAPVR